MAKAGGKVWGGILGMMFGGPLGAIAGIYIGHHIDSASEKISSISEADVFQINLMAILAYVAKVDGHIDQREIETILTFFRQTGFRQMDAIQRTLKFALTKDIDLRSTCENFKRAANYDTRLMLLRMVYLVVMADEVVHPKEREAIEQIVKLLGIADQDYQMLQAEFFTTDDRYYQILGLERGASLGEVKKAYRNLACSHHPDKVAHLGPEYTAVAQNKFKTITEAYNSISKELQAA